MDAPFCARAAMTDRNATIARMARDIRDLRRAGHTPSFACLRTLGWTETQILDWQVLALDRASKVADDAPTARGNPILQVAKTVAGFIGDAAEIGAIVAFAAGVCAAGAALSDMAGRLA